MFDRSKRLFDKRMVPLFVVHRDKQARWQLQHSGALTLAQMCDQDGLAVGKLKGVMVNV